MREKVRSSSRNLLMLGGGTLWVLLAWQVAVSLLRIPGRTVMEWASIVLAPALLGGLVLGILVAAKEGVIVSPGRLGLDLKRESSWLWLTLVIMGSLFLAAGISYLEPFGFFLAIPIVVATIGFCAVAILSVVKLENALLAFFLLLPVLAFAQVEVEYTQVTGSSVLLVPIDALDASLLASPVRHFLAMSPQVPFVLVMFGAWVLGVLQQRNEWGRTSLDWPLLLFVAVCLFSALFSMNVALSLSYWIEAILIPAMLLYAIAQTVRSHAQARRIVIAMVAAVGVATLYDLHKLYQQVGLWNIGLADAPEEMLRRTFSFGNANLSASVYVLVIPLALVLLNDHRESITVRGASALFLSVASVALLANGSRGGWLGVGVEIVVLALLIGRRLLGHTWLLFPMGAAAWRFRDVVSDRLGFLLTGEAPSTALQRLHIWGIGLSLARAHPWTGIGLGVLPEMRIPYADLPYTYSDFHSLFLSVAAEAGLIAVVGLAVILVATLVRGIRFRRVAKLQRQKDLMSGLIASLAGFLVVASTTGAELSHRHVVVSTLVWWSVMALMLSTTRGDWDDGTLGTE